MTTMNALFARAMDMAGHGNANRVLSDVPSLAVTVRLPKVVTGPAKEAAT